MSDRPEIDAGLLTLVRALWAAHDQTNDITLGCAWDDLPEPQRSNWLTLAGTAQALGVGIVPAADPTVSGPTGDALIAAAVIEQFAATGRQDTPGFTTLLEQFPTVGSRGNLKVILWALAKQLRTAGTGPTAADDVCWCDGPDCGQTPCRELIPAGAGGTGD